LGCRSAGRFSKRITDDRGRAQRVAIFGFIGPLIQLPHRACRAASDHEVADVETRRHAHHPWLEDVVPLREIQAERPRYAT
jgi:hypothetical protein